MTHPIKFPKTVPAPLLLAGMEAQLYNGTGNLPVVSSVALLLPARPHANTPFSRPL